MRISPTIAERRASAGNTRGFDYLRIGLALGVLAWHGIYISGDEAAKNAVLQGPLGSFRALILPMFFALSGFLVAGSLHRSRTLEGFMTLRVLRLVPALAVEVLLSVLLLGPLMTSLPLGDYFADAKVRTYLLNVIGWIHFQLPGVFIDNPRPNVVNLSLWTVPYELECYLLLMLVSVTGVFTRRRMMLLAVSGAVVGLWAFQLTRHGGVPINTITLPGRVLVLGFLVGMLLSVYADRVPLSLWLAVLSLVAAVVMVGHRSTMVLCIVPAAYLTVWLGMLDPPKIPVLMDGDYSYGVYLFAYPMQQALATVPTLRPWYVAVPIAIGLSLLYAAASWHLVEKRVMDRKKTAVRWMERQGDRMRRHVGPLRGVGLIGRPG